jgi:hypothetical protein
VILAGGTLNCEPDGPLVDPWPPSCHCVSGDGEAGSRKLAQRGSRRRKPGALWEVRLPLATKTGQRLVSGLLTKSGGIHNMITIM